MESNGEDDYIILDDGKLSRLQATVNQKKKYGYKPQNMLLNSVTGMYSVAMIREPNKNINFKAFKRNVHHDMDAIRFNIKNQSSRISELEELRKRDLEYIETLQDKVKSILLSKKNDVVKDESHSKESKSCLSVGYDVKKEKHDDHIDQLKYKPLITDDPKPGCLTGDGEPPLTFGSLMNIPLSLMGNRQGKSRIPRLKEEFAYQYQQCPVPSCGRSFDLSEFSNVCIIADPIFKGIPYLCFKSDYELDDIREGKSEFRGDGWKRMLTSFESCKCEEDPENFNKEIYSYKFLIHDKE